jgi:hydrogenase nickel insertion protein HypA
VHETAIAQSIINTVLRAIDRRDVCVDEIGFRAGILRAVMPDALHFAFEVMKKKYPPLEFARLQFEHIPLTVECFGCGYKWESERINFICPKCESVDTSVTGGNSMEVTHILIDENDKGDNHV